MAYTAWSVVFGEQPTAAKWNQLGTNDAGFKDGTNIDNLAILNRHIADFAIEAKKMKIDTATLSYASGWGQFAGHSVKVIRIAGMCMLVGLITKTSSWVSGATMATIPTGFRPASTYNDSNAILSQAHSTASTSQGGQINLYNAGAGVNAGQIAARIAGAANDWIAVYGIIYQCEPY